MSNANHVERVTLTIETANGELHQLVVHKPGPQGGNPRYMAQQVVQAIETLDRRANDLMLGAYGDQISANYA